MCKLRKGCSTPERLPEGFAEVILARAALRLLRELLQNVRTGHVLYGRDSKSEQNAATDA